MMARFPYPDYEDKAFAAAGKPTINVFKLLSYSPATVDHWCTIGNAHFTKVSLTKKLREFVILLSSAKFGSFYEWTHHVPLSAKFGITDAQREELLKAGKAKGVFSQEYWAANSAGMDPEEQVLLTFLEAVIDSGEIDEGVWQRTTAVFPPRAIMEIITMQVSNPRFWCV
jgi:alkylhydroperoxidase family enzyme